MTAHDERDVETVAEVIRLRSPLSMRQARAFAPAVLDALELRGRERHAAGRALRGFADTITVQTAARIVEDMLARAAELDPEEADDDA